MAATLPTREQVERIFGAANVLKWADVDNNQDKDTIFNRIEWAIEEAGNEINGRLGLKYNVAEWTTYPALVFSLVTRQAGIVLARSPRGIEDGDVATASLASMQLKIDADLTRILGGQVRLIDATDNPINVPGVNVHKANTINNNAFFEDAANFWEVET